VTKLCVCAWVILRIHLAYVARLLAAPGGYVCIRVSVCVCVCVCSSFTESLLFVVMCGRVGGFTYSLSICSEASRCAGSLRLHSCKCVCESNSFIESVLCSLLSRL
jgi:hypothetical protein